MVSSLLQKSDAPLLSVAYVWTLHCVQYAFGPSAAACEVLAEIESRRVCHMCHLGAICDKRHVLQECPALADVRVVFTPFAPLIVAIAEGSGIMAQQIWADDQPSLSKYIIACLIR